MYFCLQYSLSHSNKYTMFELEQDPSLPIFHTNFLALVVHAVYFLALSISLEKSKDKNHKGNMKTVKSAWNLPNSPVSNGYTQTCKRTNKFTPPSFLNA